MSLVDTKQRMIHAAVNTDPLQHNMIENQKQPIHYGLKERNIPHIKINEMKELQVWYDFGGKLGEGGFGSVMIVTEKGSNKVWAMKVVSKSNAGVNLQLVQQEIGVLKLIQHPHIIYLDKIFESSKSMYMIFERCYDFANIYARHKPFPERLSKKIISELVDAVAYLHKYDIVHRDLKMENLLVGENPNDPTDEYYIKLTDFGLSIHKFGKGFETSLHDYCGTLHYMAPEIITKRAYTEMCDMWSVGVILYMLLVGNYPFFASDEKELKVIICTKEPVFKKTDLTAEATNLILQLLVKNPVNRIRATEVLQHPWMLDRKLSKNIEFNILDKMKEWKSEMKVETGSASDWVLGSFENLDKSRSVSKQAMQLPKTNIMFDRNKRRSSKSKETPLKPSQHNNHKKTGKNGVP
ncbi:hypothetical protein Zmor_009723 [Zophobas morio]|uniref:Protein kinase domain-containing protein n=1 Tax=Zophobas morio TaxID=2755281 RepID=A0AA38IMP9_9CUCU|nr:hypothetical protein Zmor_009723 [Zophobas morio]